MIVQDKNEAMATEFCTGRSSKKLHLSRFLFDYLCSLPAVPLSPAKLMPMAGPQPSSVTMDVVQYMAIIFLGLVSDELDRSKVGAGTLYPCDFCEDQNEVSLK